MKIAVLRKPLESTVAQNILAYGTGGINIDATRTSTPPRMTHKEGSFTGSRVNPVKHLSRLGNIEASVPEGRWPANLIIQHTPWCTRMGTERIQGTKDGGLTDTPARSWKNKSTKGINRIGYADANGEEQVEVWACAPGCPAKLLNQQFGGLGSRYFKNIQASSEFHDGEA